MEAIAHAAHLAVSEGHAAGIRITGGRGRWPGTEYGEDGQ